MCLGHQNILTSISNISNPLYLPWAFQLNVGCFKDGTLVLTLVLVAMAPPLLLLGGPAASIISRSTAFNTSTGVHACDNLGHHLCIFHFSYFLWAGLVETVLCQSPSLRQFWVCLVKTCLSLLTLCNVTWCNKDNTSGCFYIIYYISFACVYYISGSYTIYTTIFTDM